MTQICIGVPDRSTFEVAETASDDDFTEASNGGSLTR